MRAPVLRRPGPGLSAAAPSRTAAPAAALRSFWASEPSPGRGASPDEADSAWLRGRQRGVTGDEASGTRGDAGRTSRSRAAPSAPPPLPTRRPSRPGSGGGCTWQRVGASTRTLRRNRTEPPGRARAPLSRGCRRAGSRWALWLRSGGIAESGSGPSGRRRRTPQHAVYFSQQILTSFNSWSGSGR